MKDEYINLHPDDVDALFESAMGLCALLIEHSNDENNYIEIAEYYASILVELICKQPDSYKKLLIRDMTHILLSSENTKEHFKSVFERVFIAKSKH